MSSEKFEDLEEDFVSLMDDMRRKLESVKGRGGVAESKKSQLREIQRKVDQAGGVLQEMEHEARSAPNPYRVHMNSKTRKYRSELDELNKTASTLAGGATHVTIARQDLLSPSSVLGDFGSGDPQRSRLLQMNETLNRTTDSLARTFQVAAETDQIGTAVAEELRTQRESLVRTKERLEETDQNLTTSRKILRTMYRRVMTNKMILILIIVIEMCILGALIYWKFIMK